jgi:5-dehydro-4-deoxyglucarate dehydratase
MSPQEMAARIGGGLLSFPVTHFDQDFAFDEAAYRDHLAWLGGYDVAGLFAAGGTGEFFSLRPQEVPQIVKAAVEEAGDKVPVLAGCGYGTAIATDLAVEIEKAGAKGLLLLPPYLVNSTQEGLAAHIGAVCKSTSLGVIVYNRDNAIVHEDTLARLCDRNANLVGYKDGIGDVELMMRIYARMGDRLTYVGGLPTAETFAPAYLEMGVTTYSSAIFNFMPEWALAFYQAVRARDKTTIIDQLNAFVLPYIAIRNRGAGYAVSIVKAGMRAIGRPAGGVRPPLTDLNDTELQELAALIENANTGLKAVA